MTDAAGLPDRALAVPPGALLRSAYVPIHTIRFANKSRMSVGDVARAYRRALRLGPRQQHPTPNGAWDGGWFVVADGRHTVVALLMLGFEYVLVTWVEGPHA